jgi:hypothetical protein
VNSVEMNFEPPKSDLLGAPNREMLSSFSSWAFLIGHLVFLVLVPSLLGEAIGLKKKPRFDLVINLITMTVIFLPSIACAPFLGRHLSRNFVRSFWWGVGRITGFSLIIGAGMVLWFLGVLLVIEFSSGAKTPLSDVSLPVFAAMVFIFSVLHLTLNSLLAAIAFVHSKLQPNHSMHSTVPLRGPASDVDR